MTARKRYGRRKNLEESLREDRLLSQRLRLTRHLTQVEAGADSPQ